MVQIESHLNIPYPEATHPRQALDLFLPSGASELPLKPLLVFIHGGAWIWENKEDFTDNLAPALVAATNGPVAFLEYRLAPNDPHPAQINDVLSGLALLLSPLLSAERGVQRWDRSRIYLAGHSAGAFMIASLLLRPPQEHSSFVVPAYIRAAIRGGITVDGVYDFPIMVNEYPLYAEEFVDCAFGKNQAVLALESPMRWGLYPPSATKLRVLVMHARDDDLVSLRQPKLWMEHLVELLGEGGGAEEQYDTIKGTHMGSLHDPAMPIAIAAWMVKVEGEN